MGRLRNRRRGGGPAKTLTGLNRAGAANKILANQGGIQNPTVGDIQAGREVEIVATNEPKVEKVGRFLGAVLIDCDPTNGGEIPEDSTVDEREVNWTKRGLNLVVWTDGGTVTCRFWVF